MILFSLSLALSIIAFTTSDQIHDYNVSSSEIGDYENKIRKTSLKISEIDAISGKNFMNFTVINTGLEKFWNYEKFNLIVTYDADISGTSTKTTESFTHDASSSFLSPTLSSDITDSIVFDSVSYANKTSGSTLNFSHTVTTTGNNKFLIVNTGSHSSPTFNITYDGQVLTKVREDQESNIHSSFWYLLDPPTGSNVVSVTHPGVIIAGATSFTGVHQIQPIGSDEGNTSNINDPITTISTNDSAWIADVVAVQNNNNGIVVDSSQTERYNIELSNIISGHSTRNPPDPGNYDMKWSLLENTNWSHSVITIEPGITTDIACTASASFDTNDWIIDSIRDDRLDPHILNNDETMRICAKLAYPIYANGEIQATFVTDTGIANSKTITLTG